MKPPERSPWAWLFGAAILGGLLVLAATFARSRLTLNSPGSSPAAPPSLAPYPNHIYAPPTAALVTPEPWNWGSGIIERGEAPFAGMMYAISNFWFGMVNNQRTIVYAGAARHNPGQSLAASRGLLIVITATPLDEYPPEFYYLGADSGRLTISGEENLRLILDTPGGQTYYFDVPARQFVTSLSAGPLATITGIPSPTASPPPTAYPFVTGRPQG